MNQADLRQEKEILQHQLTDIVNYSPIESFTDGFFEQSPKFDDDYTSDITAYATMERHLEEGRKIKDLPDIELDSDILNDPLLLINRIAEIHLEIDQQKLVFEELSRRNADLQKKISSLS